MPPLPYSFRPICFFRTIVYRFRLLGNKKYLNTYPDLRRRKADAVHGSGKCIPHISDKPLDIGGCYLLLRSDLGRIAKGIMWKFYDGFCGHFAWGGCFLPFVPERSGSQMIFLCKPFRAPKKYFPRFFGSRSDFRITYFASARR